MAIIYHYCNYETFKKIITNKTLRLSDIRKSNDKYEMDLFLKQHEGAKEIPEDSSRINTDYWKMLIEEIDRVTNEMRCFASCLSVGADKLSQWERYGDNCKGVAIGFNKEKLINHIEKVAESLSGNNSDDIVPKIVAEKVTYKKLKYFFWFNDIHKQYKQIRENPLNYYKECAFTKHIGFWEEKEFRIALLFKKGGNKFLDGDFLNHIGMNENNVKSYKISEKSEEHEKEYIDLKFPESLIEEVYIGPLGKAEGGEDTRKLIIKDLWENGIRCKTKQSEIPYRQSKS